MDIHPKHARILVSVVDDYTKGPREILTTISTIDTETGGVQTAVQGHDFYAYPTFNAEGTKLAFVRWSFPDMPWKSSQIVVVDVVFRGSEMILSSEIIVAGEIGVSVAQQPQWLSGGSLAFICDRSGWAQPYLWDPISGKSKPILKDGIDEDFIEPLWQLGESNYTFLTDSCMLCTSFRNGFSNLYLVGIPSGLLSPITCPYVTIRRIRRVSNNSAVFIGCKVDEEDSLVQITFADVELTPNYHTLATISSKNRIPAGYLSVPEPLVLNDKLGRDLHVLYTPPKNPLFKGLPGEKPPAIVFIHAGPHMCRSPGLWWHRLLYNSRGWAW